MNEGKNNVPIPRLESVTAKTQPGKPVFSVITCSGEPLFSDSIGRMIQWHLGDGYDVRVTDRDNAIELLELVDQQPFDLIVPLVNNIHHTTGDREGAESRIRKAVELLGRLRAQYGKPIIALSAFEPKGFDLPGLIKREGIDAFFWTPPPPQEFLTALEVCLKTGRDPQGTPGEMISPPPKARPLRIVVVDDESWCLEMVGTLILSKFKHAALQTFQDGGTAWQELSRAGPDLLITDMIRGGMNGWEMLPLLAQRKVKYPILVTSGYAQEKDVRQCAGPDLVVSFLQKPYTSEQFWGELFKHLGPGDNLSKQI